MEEQIRSMFEMICIRRQHPFELSEPLDLGFLAEAMLFYQSVHLIADGSTITQLVPESVPSLDRTSQRAFLENQLR